MVLAQGPYGGECLKIVDFAPSVPRQGHPNDPLVTCSPGYASPEQLGAREDVDGRADVWALGAVLYELLTGRRAFPAATLPDMLQAIGRVPEAMKTLRPEVPAGLDVIVRRCLARDREVRFESARHLRKALVAVHVNEEAEASWRAAASVRAEPANLVPPRSRRAVTPPSTPPARIAPFAPLLGSFFTSRVGRNVFLAALGPACAVLSMTIVRLLLASHLVSAAPPAQWPAAVPLPRADIAAR
jgi:serine/threonine-protein kinase